MDSLCLFAAKHKTLTSVLLFVALFGLLSLLFFGFGVSSSALIVLAFLFCLLLSLLLPQVAQNRFLNRAIKALHEQCDPYPLLEENEYFLRFKNSKAAAYVLHNNCFRFQRKFCPYHN